MSGSTLAVLGGSGLYTMPGLEDVREQRVVTPFGEPSDAIVSARLGEARLLFLPRHGRDHRIAAHEVNYRANIYALKLLGATHVLSVSAVGSLREDIAPGDVVLVDQYVDRTQGRKKTFFEGCGVVVHAGFADPVDARLRGVALEAAGRVGARTHDGGTYLCIDGPQFSTRAESRLHRAWGLDVIGMTNLPEARLAREAELPYASLCMVTDYDVWHATEAPVEVARVIALLRGNAELAARIVRAIAGCGFDPSSSPATHALDTALLTPLRAIDAAAKVQLGILLARVLEQKA